ncbi:MAG: kelch repeat-containing protein, partial [Terracidiphilus sp.]
MRNRISSLLAASLCGLLLGFASLPAAAQTTAPNEWTWMGGRQTGTFLTYPNGLPGVYGTLGMPAAGNIPGARDSAATWTDSKGNLWLFGGEGVDDNGKFGQLNDLWELNPTTQQWAWMGGSSTLPASCAGSATVACGQPGTYGTLGSPAAANGPGGRSNASYWTDNDGNFWLYGGVGFDAGQILGDLNDLWEFNPTTKEWTWMGGSSTVGINGGQSGVYGTL